MRLILLLLFIGVPILEIAVLIEVGSWIGLWPTLGLVVLTAIVGSIELRAQGLATMNRLRQEVDQGIVPAQTLFDGVCLLFAGALLLTPGFVTDAVGILLFLAPFRRFLRRTLGATIVKHAHVKGQGAHFRQTHAGPRGPRPKDAPIDADYVDITETDTEDKDHKRGEGESSSPGGADRDPPPRRLE